MNFPIQENTEEKIFSDLFLYLSNFYHSKDPSGLMTVWIIKRVVCYAHTQRGITIITDITVTKAFEISMRHMQGLHLTDTEGLISG